MADKLRIVVVEPNNGGGLVHFAYQMCGALSEQGMDVTGWLEYFVGGLMQQLEEVKNRGTAIIRADVVAKAHRLGVRQTAVLVAIHEAGMLSLSELEPLFTNVSRRSLQRDLRLLLEKGLVRESGAVAVTDPNRSYVPVVDATGIGRSEL